MLIEFSVANYRSFLERQTLSMVASKAKEHKLRNTFSTQLPGMPPLVRSAAMFGPNAAGKTNLLTAIHFMQQMVLTSATMIQAGQKLNVKRFMLSDVSLNTPSEFEAHFIHEGVRYQYGFATTDSDVVSEWLTAYPYGRPQHWFARSFNSRTKKTKWEFGSKLKGRANVWQDATRTNALFLSTAVQLNNKQLLPIFKWFQDRLSVVVPGVSFNHWLTYHSLSDPATKASVMKFLNAADLGISDIEVKRRPAPFPNQAQTEPISGHVFATSPGTLEVFSAKMRHSGATTKTPVYLDLSEESHGTQNLFMSVGAWLKVFENGATAVVDELDSSLHPKIVRYLIELFQNPKINKHNAQLIFSTHNTSILTPELFRRDQIWFVEKNKKQSSTLYSLAEFSARKEEVFEKHYLRGRYGALPIVGEFALNG